MTTNKDAKATLLQAVQDKESSAKAFQDFMRSEIRSTLWNLMKEEVKSLCGGSVEGQVFSPERRGTVGA